MPGVIVQHTGPRDNYEVALALEQTGLLHALVTNAYDVRNGGPLQRALSALAPIQRRLPGRSRSGLSDDHVMPSWGLEIVSQGAYLCGERIGRATFAWQEKQLSKKAARMARESDCAAVLSYNYCAYHVFRLLQGSAVKRILFQCHPHPRTARRILRDELQRSPEWSLSLNEEKELSWGDKYFRQLEAEPRMADLIIVASTFTRDSLIENAIDPKRIVVVPYGTDDFRFEGVAASSRCERGGSLRVLFVGQMGQRKGVRDLLNACEFFGWNRCDLTICGRGFDLDPAALSLGSRSITIRRGLSNEDLAQEYRSADVLVLPSVLEGFGLVLLEAIRFGLPLIATTNTGAPDIIQNEREGFIVPIRSPEAIASCLDVLWREPEKRKRMSEAALCTAATLTWARFRQSVCDAVLHFLTAPSLSGKVIS